MKKQLSIGLMLFAAYAANAQVAIGKESINGNSTLFDFYDNADNFRGVILPAVENLNNALAATNTAANNGTFLFDKSDKKLKVYENNSWKDLSDVGNDANLHTNTAEENTQEQGVIIGAESSEAKGVLVLEAADKAVILPKIANPHTTVKSPYPGMMCYDTASKTVALFDGKVWNYWK